MIPLTLAQAADVVGGDVVRAGDGARRLRDVQIDSRAAGEGTLFVALAGSHADGHEFIPDAVARGAAGWLGAAGRDLPDVAGGIVVDDPADALLGLGTWIRDQVAPLVVAVTGSNGKTTVKDFAAACIGSTRAVVANPGSYNNDLGVPLTCCLLEHGTEVLVAEVGARGRGHIARLAGPLAPDVAVVTTVAPAHLGLFGTLDAVAAAKGELVESLDAGGVAVLNADDARVRALGDRCAGTVVTYGVDAPADWQATEVQLDAAARASFTVRGTRVQLPVPGEHMVGNALAALAAADAVGVPLEAAAAALARAQVSRWRMQLRTTPAGVVVINDAYNANPASMEAALRTLAATSCQGRRWAVLGPMAELGDGTAAAHDRIGRLVIRLGIDGLVAVGDDAAGIRHAADQEGFYGQGDCLLATDADDAVALLSGRLRAGDVVLVKASRAAGLERVAAGLEELAP